MIRSTAKLGGMGTSQCLLILFTARIICGEGTAHYRERAAAVKKEKTIVKIKTYSEVSARGKRIIEERASWR